MACAKTKLMYRMLWSPCTAERLRFSIEFTWLRLHSVSCYTKQAESGEARGRQRGNIICIGCVLVSTTGNKTAQGVVPPLSSRNWECTRSTTKSKITVHSVLLAFEHTRRRSMGVGCCCGLVSAAANLARVETPCQAKITPSTCRSLNGSAYCARSTRRHTCEWVGKTYGTYACKQSKVKMYVNASRYRRVR